MSLGKKYKGGGKTKKKVAIQNKSNIKYKWKRIEKGETFALVDRVCIVFQIPFRSVKINS